MITATLTSKGRLTVPKEVRDALGLKEGQQVVFVLEDGRAWLHPVPAQSFAELAGVLKGRRPYAGREAEREAARRTAAAEALDSGATGPLP